LPQPDASYRGLDFLPACSDQSTKKKQRMKLLHTTLPQC
jgi:hypothetical protein